MPLIFQSEFFWGTVIGLLLSFAGGYLQAHISQRKQQAHIRNTVKTFCVYTIKTVQSICNEMDAHRDKTRVIHADYLKLLDAELDIYSRNREQIIHLPEQLRDDVRRFLTECSLRRAEIVAGLEAFYRMEGERTRAFDEGRTADCERCAAKAGAIITDANHATAKLVDITRRADPLITKLSAA